MKKKQKAPAAPGLELMGSRQFNAWLAEQKASLAFTTYQAGKLFLIGLQPDGRLSIFERTFNRCMGLHASAQTLYMTSLYHLWRFENSLEPGQPKDTSDSALYEIYRAFATDDEAAAIAKRYAESIGWGDMKQLLFERINAEIAPARAEYERLMANPREVEDVLREGAERARAVSRPFLAEIRDKVGVRPLTR